MARVVTAARTAVLPTLAAIHHYQQQQQPSITACGRPPIAAASRIAARRAANVYRRPTDCRRHTLHHFTPSRRCRDTIR